MERKKSLISSTISRLKKDLKNGNPSAVDDFWLKIEKEGTPLIETIKEDINHKLVIFIVKADKDTKNAVIICALADQDNILSHNICERIKNTDIFYKNFIVLNGTRVVYTISKNNSLKYQHFYDNLMRNWDTCSPDPFNSKNYVQRYRREGKSFTLEYSVLEMPDAKPRLYTILNNDITPGNLDEIDFYSEILNSERKIWVYTPNNFDKNGKPYFFLLFLDGKAFLEFTQPQIILDNLQDKNKIPPVVAIFIHNYSGFMRGKDLNCYPPFVDFIAKELVPWARKNYNITTESTQSVAIGNSSGGLTASFLGLKYPKIFGNILSQSGYYNWWPGTVWFKSYVEFYGRNYVRWWSKEDQKHPEWLTKQFMKHERLPLKFYVNIGNLETNNLRALHNFRNMLQQKGYTYHYEEYPGGHEYIAWREQLPEGLIYLIGVKSNG